MPPRDANIQHMIDEVNALGRNLSRWEEDFMIDITQQWEDTRDLSPSQLKKLEQIYEEKV